MTEMTIIVQSYRDSQRVDGQQDLRADVSFWRIGRIVRARSMAKYVHIQGNGGSMKGRILSVGEY
jgi:hypothetical protein